MLCQCICVFILNAFYFSVYVRIYYTLPFKSLGLVIFFNAFESLL